MYQASRSKRRYIARDPLGRWCVVTVTSGEGYGGSGRLKTWTPLGIPRDTPARLVSSMLQVIAAGGVDCRRYAGAHPAVGEDRHGLH